MVVDLKGADASEISFFRTRCLTDTGFLARNLMGHNYDVVGDQQVNIGSGGIRDYGPHQEMVEFIDSSDEFQLLMAPRKTLKSTLLLDYIVRRILLNPNIRVLYGTSTDKMAVQFSIAVRNALELPQVTSLFGDQKGDPARDGRPWENDRFTVAGRTNRTLTSPTFRTFSLQTRPVGGRAELIVGDDLIYEENVRTKEAIENAKMVVAMLFPFREDQSKTVIAGTKYADMDLYYDLENNPLYKKWIRGAGVKVIEKPNGALDLELEEGLSEPLFPNLTMDMLRKALHSMSSKNNFTLFSCQYLNTVPHGVGVTFKRQHFLPAPWTREMMAYTGYLLTDTATSDREAGSYSVIAYVLMDQVGRYLLADLRVGHMQPAEFIDAFFSVLDYWKSRCNHCGELWERISMTDWAQSMLTLDPRSKRIRPQPIVVNRNRNSFQKQKRILSFEPVMRERRFLVLDTVPKLFTDVDGERVLYDREGFISPKSKVRLPAGELVDEFVNLGKAGVKTDIADAIALAVELNPDVQRPYCVFRKPPRELLDRAGLTGEEDRPYTPRLVDVDAPGGDWWERTTRRTFR